MSRPLLPQVILITGAAGFIGGHLLEELHQSFPGIRLIALDRNPASQLSADFFYRMELSNETRSTLHALLEEHQVEAVIHCAGSSRPEKAVLRRDNLEAAGSLLAAAASARPGLLFCHIGSSAEYRPLPMPQKTREDTPTEPIGEYGRVKLEVTQMVQDYTRKGRIRGYVLRLFNPIGVGMPETHLVGRIGAALRAGTVSVFTVGNLNTYRDYIDVRDVARGIAASLVQAEQLTGQVINLGSGQAHHTREVVIGLLKHLPGPVRLVEAETPGSFRSPDVEWQEADIALAAERLDWVPQISFQETLEYIAQKSRLGSDVRDRK